MGSGSGDTRGNGGSGGRRPAVAPELAAQLEVFALRGGERSLKVLGLGAVALLALILAFRLDQLGHLHSNRSLRCSDGRTC